MLSQLAAHFLRRVRVDEMLSAMERVCEHDRYQASHGIERAALLVAEMAERIGLDRVTVDRFPADGATRWWTFAAPVSWTPRVARLVIHGGGAPSLSIDHALQPFSVATYSAPTAPAGVRARLVDVSGGAPCGELAGAIAILPRAAFEREDPLRAIASAGAIGFLTDATSRGAAPGPEHPGRIELDPFATLFGFSLTTSQLELTRRWAAEGAEAEAAIEIDRSASMPTVTGVIPGTPGDEEVWLTAHLCHPRPGANDNASGVAALLGVASALLRSRETIRPRRTIRFFWGPEYLGVAATLHARAQVRGRASAPAAVINLDMVGEDQQACGCPFILERAPDLRASLINPLAERAVEEVFAQTRSGGGVWRSSPFLGFSDHALFADPKIGSPAVQLCHAPDRFNHSAADTLDKVSPLEMLRSTAVASVLTTLLAGDDVIARPETERVVRDWCAKEQATARAVADEQRALDGGAWSAALVELVQQRNADLLALLDGISPAKGRVEPRGRVISPRWPGPFNARGMLGHLSVRERESVADLLRQNKFNYAIITNFAIRIDGTRSRDEIVRQAKAALGRPIDPRAATELFDALLSSGWATEEEAAGPASAPQRRGGEGDPGRSKSLEQ